MKNTQNVNPFWNDLVDNPVHVYGTHLFDGYRKLPGPVGNRLAKTEVVSSFLGFRFE